MNKETSNGAKLTSDIDSAFYDLIMDGFVSKEEQIIKGLTMKLKPLTTDELFNAEREINEDNPNIPADITAKLRCAKILSYALISLNGNPMETDGMTEFEIKDRRLAIYIKLTQSPIRVIENAWSLYMKTVEEQDSFYSLPKLNEASENFSERSEEK